MKHQSLIFFIFLTYNVHATFHSNKLDSIFPTYQEFKKYTKNEILEKYGTDSNAKKIIDYYQGKNKKHRVLSKTFLIMTAISLLSLLVVPIEQRYTTCSGLICIPLTLLLGLSMLMFIIPAFLILLLSYLVNGKRTLYRELKYYVDNGKISDWMSWQKKFKKIYNVDGKYSIVIFH